MGTRIRISNLPTDVDSGELEDMFMAVGNVITATIDQDHISGISSGIGFVEMASEQEMLDGVDRFNGQTKSGQRLNVREDKPHVAVNSLAMKSSERRKTFESAKNAFGKKTRGKKQ